MNTLKTALLLAKAAHAGQTDKAGKPYLGHPVAVSELVGSENEKIAALLHDIVEDTCVTLEDLKDAGFDGEVVEAVRLLTKVKDGNFDIDRYLRELKADPIARAVKIADLTNNMDISGIPYPTENDWKRVRKYETQLEFLQDGAAGIRKAVKLREKSEWANFWWESADDDVKPRVLLVGDSITNGYRRTVQDLLKGVALVDMLATSKAVDDLAFLRELRLALADYRYAAVHFNSGLHGAHMSARTYKACYGQIIGMLEARCPAVILAASTPMTVPGDEANLLEPADSQVRERNAAVAEIAAERRLRFEDLYAASAGKAELRHGDGCHFNGSGYALLGGIVAESLRDIMKEG